MRSTTIPSGRSVIGVILAVGLIALVAHVDWQEVISAIAAADYALLALQGPKAAAILQSLTGAKLGLIKYYHFGEGTVAGIHCLLSRTGYTGEDGFELYHAAADAPALALGIVLAWTVMFFRVAIMTLVIDRQLGARIAVALGLVCTVSLGTCYWLWRRHQRQERGEVKAGSNPFELDQAIKFGLLFVGGTVLLGGIKRLREGRNEFGVPILSKIPYINRLFKNVGMGRTTDSLMLMVTPRIIIQEEEEDKLLGTNRP